MYGIIFFVIDVLNEKYGLVEVKKVVWFGFLMFLMLIFVM